uniref:Uncharacterized protein n=1 Tax=Desulfovibrio sp. U5L TaxID=596152 RepID=I2PZX9_9BACT
MQPLTYDGIVTLEPRILEAEDLAREHAGSATYGPWYRIVKPAFLPLVGILSTHADPRLRTSEAYDIVYRHLLGVYEVRPDDLMPPPIAAPAPLSPDEGKRICPACGQDKRDAESCGGPMIQVAGRVYERVRFGQEQGHRWEEFDFCPECGVSHGGLHHPGCDIEECPRCRTQYLSCDCGKEDDGPEDAPGDSEAIMVATTCEVAQ